MSAANAPLAAQYLLAVMPLLSESSQAEIRAGRVNNRRVRGELALLATTSRISLMPSRRELETAWRFLQRTAAL